MQARGTLKIYLGFAAGVGKTYRMLEEAHSLHQQQINITIGLVETHHRPETEVLVAGLPLIARKKFSYRGVDIEEMDLDAILQQRPQLVIVDELPHTNVPGSRNNKRYQDVLELIDAGISVITAMDVQHIESLRDVVERVTRVAVRETVPDVFLQQADQIVTLDLDVNDLLARLRSGKIYAPDKITRAQESFFTEANLTALRELALREVAHHIERVSYPKLASTKELTASKARVMVCISSYSPRAAALLRRGSRLSGRLNTHWFVVYVETPREAPTRIDAEAQRHLADNIHKAKELGAEVIKLSAKDPVVALLDFAYAHNVGHLIVGRSHQPWYKRIFGRGFMERMVHMATGLDLHIVSSDRELD